MNKIIIIRMQPDKEIVVLRDQIEKLRIPKDTRKINAEDIYQLFDYNVGDTFEIEKENPGNVDAPVVDFFYELIKDIADQISSYAEEQDGIDNSSEEEGNENS